MSIPVMNACWGLKMPPTAKAILISLADNANDSGEAWPSIDTIAERTCVSRRSVIDAIKWLEESQVIVADRSNGRHTKYTVTPQNFAPSDKRSTRSEGRKTSADAARVPVQMPHGCGKHTGADAAPTSADAARVPVQMPHQPVQMPHTNHHKPSDEPSITINRRARKSIVDLPNGFEEFWEAYPRKDARQDAIKAWGQLRLGTNAELRSAVMAGLVNWRKHPTWLKGDRQFIKLPAAWLRGERWKDQSVQPPAGGGDGAQWWLPAGFPNVHEAENAQCYAHNASQFRDGKRQPVQRQEVLA